MKTFIVSMSLFVVVAAYVAVRSPVNKAESTDSSIVHKEKKENVEQSTAAAYRKAKKASAEDWAAVHAIAQEYAVEIGNTVDLREKLKMSEYYGRYGGNNCSPELSAKCNEVNLAYSQAARKVRDLEREQWARMAEYLSPYELRKYKLDHSQFAHDLRMETEWFQPNKGEFLALFTYHERKQNLYDEMSGKDKKMEELFQSARKKIDAVHEEMWHSVPKIFRNAEKVARSIDALEGEDMDFYRARMRLKRGIDSMSRERWLEYDNRKFLPPEQVVRVGVLKSVEELVKNGQATQWDLEEARIRYHAAAIANDSSREEYIEKKLARLEETKRQAEMSPAEKMQQVKERHAKGQLTDAELEAVRIKIAAEEEFNNLQTNGQSSRAEALAQEAQEKIERLLGQAASRQQ